MTEVSATEAARCFSDLLDAVEHGGESFTIVRHGKVVAHIEPSGRGRGAVVKDLLRRHHVDSAWIGQLTDLRELAPLEHRT